MSNNVNRTEAQRVPKFLQGQHVYKHTGSYWAPAKIRSVFYTSKGDVRYVADFEDQPGLLHIFAEEQLDTVKEYPYLSLLRKVMNHGTLKLQRGRTAGGQDLRTRAVFGAQMSFDLGEGFPLLTTKKLSLRLILEEFLWFLSGSTNNNDLRARGVTIWDEWAHPETGELGPIYGKQWRRWEGPQGQVDQIAKLIEGIHAVKLDPRASVGRRLILTAWNPADMPTVSPGASYTPAPPACHTLSQFDVTDGKLSCQLYQRSADMFLGVPFNIACYALLTHLLAQVTGLGVGKFVHTFGDAHVYENHFEAVEEQLSRKPNPLPVLTLDPSISSIDGLTWDMFRLTDYNPHPAIRGEVAI